MHSTLAGWFTDPQYADIEFQCGTYKMPAHGVILAAGGCNYMHGLVVCNYSPIAIEYCIGWFYGIKIKNSLPSNVHGDCMRFAQEIDSQELLARLRSVRIIWPAHAIINDVQEGKPIDTTELRKDILVRGFENAVYPIVQCISGVEFDHVLDAMMCDQPVNVAILCARTKAWGSDYTLFADRFKKFTTRAVWPNMFGFMAQLPVLSKHPAIRWVTLSIDCTRDESLYDDVMKKILEWARNV